MLFAVHFGVSVSVMFTYVISIVMMVAGSFLGGEGIDIFVRPTHFLRKPQKCALRGLPVLLGSNIFLVVTGSVMLSLIMSLMILAVIVTASNLKLRLLNEPLVFTDFSLVGSFIRHPRFYLQGIPFFLRIVVLVVGVLLVCLLIRASSSEMGLRYVGLVGMFVSGAILWKLLVSYGCLDSQSPVLWSDIRDHGLLPTLLLYAVRWRHLSSLPDRSALQERLGAPDAVVIIQCESFANPADLDESWEELPFLSRYQKEAVQWGRFFPSGLGAYTMRSEYGVLCGDDEEDLSYRCFDPFLTADQSPSHALPNRLQHFYRKALFLHPYDMRFYGRHKTMPRWGFTDIVGCERFSESDRVGPYVGDASLADFLLDYLKQNERCLAYCVTIENHGPWKRGRIGQASGEEAWHQHAKHGDEMLHKLVEGIKESGRDVFLAFFGDHRPALKALPPVEGLERSTPYVMLRPNGPKGNDVSSEPVDVTPAELHRSILRHVSS